jgi:hypothetical protein
MIGALSVCCMMTGIILNELYGRVVLPIGKPWAPGAAAMVIKVPSQVAA